MLIENIKKARNKETVNTFILFFIILFFIIKLVAGEASF